MCIDPVTIAALGQTLGASSLFTVGAGGAVAATSTATALAGIGSAAMVGMTGLSALGSMQQAKGAKQMGEYNAQIAANEGIAAQQKAAFDLKQQQRQAAQFKGTQRAQMSATGGELLDMGDVADMSATDLELEALGIRYGGQMAQTAAQQRGTLARMEGSMAARKARNEAGSTLLTGAKSGLTYFDGLASKGLKLTATPSYGTMGTEEFDYV